MWIQVRLMGGDKTVRIDSLSKLSKVETLRNKLVKAFDVEPENQRLFFRGKQMEDGHTLFDYDVGLNDLIQILVRHSTPQKEKKAETAETENEDADDCFADEINLSDDEVSSDKENKRPTEKVEEKAEESVADNNPLPEGHIYKVGDIIDARDVSMGCWFEAKIKKIEHGLDPAIQERLSAPTSSSKAQEDTSKDKEEKSSSNSRPSSSSGTDEAPEDSLWKLNFGESDGFTYHIYLEEYPEDILKVSSTEIKPRARTLLRFEDVTVGQHIMANYNYEDPEIRGFWYDCVVTDKRDERTKKELKATVYVGNGLTPLHNCRLLFIKELFGIEVPGTQLTEEDLKSDPSNSIETRKNQPQCDHCNDNPRRKCKHCGCSVCAEKKDPEKTILCDECDDAYHIYCLSPPLEKVPEEEEWFCPACKTDDSSIVKVGEKLKVSKKKAKMASATSTSNRDWGKGMACVGRSKVCTIVPSTHYGAIPGVEVGTLWKFRVQVSEAGVHRPHVAGIHGREDDGAYSIVLSGGYEDDNDDGEEFFYTGSGGRDLSGNKRTAEQSCDQTLTRMNKALAKNCNAPIDVKKGSVSKDWKGGKPVRVVRNCKLRKHSTYAPEEGNRYDGIYKVVMYWPEKGKSGYLVWRYLLRRDDPTPAPWTKAGMKRCEQLGLVMQYPDGYLENQKEKEKEDDDGSSTKKKGKKRKAEDSPSKQSPSSHPSSKFKAKKMTAVEYTLEANTKKLIEEDSLNQRLWKDALTTTVYGYKAFLEKVEELFLCICCQDVVCKPVTLQCTHNICKSCLQRSFKAEVYSCPACRAELNKDMAMETNKTLMTILNSFFPGYENGR